MTKTMFRTAVLALVASATAAHAALPQLYEEAYARDEERRIYQAPIAGIYNSPWYDYRIDVTEAQKELASDLRGADDIEDRRDAWEEYGNELAKERRHYAETMAKLGYRDGRVIVGD
jgi:16S rRNA C967 or C1407 C5-methylase (RsmB/RsmF family)